MCASSSGPLGSFVSVKHLPSNRVAPGVSSEMEGNLNIEIRNQYIKRKKPTKANQTKQNRGIGIQISECSKQAVFCVAVLA